MVAKRQRKLNKGRGTYQVTFTVEDREFVELLLKCTEDGPRLYVSKLITDLLRVAKHHYFQDREKFIEHYGPTFFQDYFAKLDKLRKQSNEH